MEEEPVKGLFGVRAPQFFAEQQAKENKLNRPDRVGTHPAGQQRISCRFFHIRQKDENIFREMRRFAFSGIKGAIRAFFELHLKS